MNKKGRIIWWTLGILLIAFGIFFSSTVMKKDSTLVKGAWQTGFLKHNFLPAQRQLLENEAMARLIGMEIAAELAENGGWKRTDSSPCGKARGINFWNEGEKLCLPDVDTFFSAYSFDLLKEKIPTRTYREVGHQGNYFYALGNKEQVVSKYGKYIFDTSLSVDIGYSFVEYEILFTEAIDLLQNCKKEELLSCLEKNKRAYWRFGTCETEEFKPENRLVPFCIRSPSSYVVYDAEGQEIPVEYKVALDFSEGTP